MLLVHLHPNSHFVEEWFHKTQVVKLSSRHRRERPVALRISGRGTKRRISIGGDFHNFGSGNWGAVGIDNDAAAGHDGRHGRFEPRPAVRRLDGDAGPFGRGRGELGKGRGRYQRAESAEEFAAMACFLCSDLAGFTTGTAINMDGGASPVV